MDYQRPYLYPKQFRAFFTDVRYSLCEASTKSGKTVGAIAWIIEKALGGSAGMNYWWVAPFSAQADIAFRRIKNNLTAGSFVARESPVPTITLLNGPTIWFKSGDNADSLFGEDVYAAVVDEASRCREESWHALRSTLTATQGPARIIGNVKGRKNWFFRLSRMAEAGTPNMIYTKITIQDAVDAGVIPADEIEDARRTLPDHVFRELYLAEAGDDTGNPFGTLHIESCIRGLSNKPPVAFGIDLAKKHDFLVVIGLDIDGCVCVFERWQHVPWRKSIQRIHEIVGEDVPALVDSTGVGDPVLEELQVEHGNFAGYVFSPLSKQRLMEGLAVSIQGHEIGFPEGPITVELDSFEYELTRTGVRYSAPAGAFDDCVCALALAREQWSTQAPGRSLMDFYVEQSKQSDPIPTSEETTLQDFGFRGPTNLEIVENELTELYIRAVAGYEPTRILCRICQQKVDGRERVTDGEFVWHPTCLGQQRVA